MNEYVFNFLVSFVNFLIFAVAFQFIVIEPMIRAVRERGEKVRARFREIEGLLAEASEMREKYRDQTAGLEAEKARLKESADREVERVVRRIEEKGKLEADHILEKARTEADMLRVRATDEVRSFMASRAVERARELLQKSLDSNTHRGILEQAVDKVGRLHAS
ncbi:MAG: ATP synthase F0 subunit B [Armatimonadetes bacterium]|nr:ATP synthase F0 subunit B [Armatimonadota bacterium]